MTHNTSIDENEVRRIAEHALSIWKVPGAAVAVVSGTHVFTAGCGVKEQDTQDAVTPNTVFALASVSKAFTATALAMLVDEGKLSWDDPVRKHLPWLRFSDPITDCTATVRDLLCHRTGMPRHDWMWYATNWSREEIVRRYGLAKPARTFRAAYDYANVPYMAAGLIVEAVAGETWEDFVRRRIFQPLGMSSATCTTADALAAADRATPHTRFHNKRLILPWLNMDREAPAGGISASAVDMARWVRFQLACGECEGKKLISKEALLETRKAQAVVALDNPDRFGLDWGSGLMSYCLGWNLQDYRGCTVTSHGGYIDGFVSRVALVPSRGVGFAALANLTGSSVIQEIWHNLLDHLLALPPVDWSARLKTLQAKAKEEDKRKKAEAAAAAGAVGGAPIRSLRCYTGRYSDAAYGDAEVKTAGGRLVLSYNDLVLPLKHHSFDLFTAKVDKPEWKADMKFCFECAPDGSICAMHVLEPFQADFKRLADAK